MLFETMLLPIEAGPSPILFVSTADQPFFDVKGPSSVLVGKSTVLEKVDEIRKW
jgi:hypothetical protein